MLSAGVFRQPSECSTEMPLLRKHMSTCPAHSHPTPPPPDLLCAYKSPLGKQDTNQLASTQPPQALDKLWQLLGYQISPAVPQIAQRLELQLLSFSDLEPPTSGDTNSLQSQPVHSSKPHV